MEILKIWVRENNESETNTDISELPDQYNEKFKKKLISHFKKLFKNDETYVVDENVDEIDYDGKIFMFEYRQ